MYMERKVKRFGILILVFILLLPCAMFLGCGIQVQSLSFDESDKTILIDETFNLNVVSQPEIEDLSITYSVADSTIAYILPDGKTVLGIKEGQTKIYARSTNGIIAEMNLTVAKEKVALSKPVGLSFNGN